MTIDINEVRQNVVKILRETKTPLTVAEIAEIMDYEDLKTNNIIKRMCLDGIIRKVGIKGTPRTHWKNSTIIWLPTPTYELCKN